MPDLENLSPAELRDLSVKAAKLAADKEKNKVSAAVYLINDTAKSIGAKVEITLAAGTAPKKTRGTMPVTHRNPLNEKEVWRGMGVKPGWLRAKLEEGATLEEFAV
jgi:DNA-binding protein H-NS